MELGGRGMTLIEVVVATAIVMTVVIGASNAVGTVNGANARASGRAAAEASAAAELEELRSLPFSTAGAVGPAPATVVSRVFPSADAGRNSADARFAPESRDGHPAGTFFTVKSVSGGRMTIAATFVLGTAAGWAPVPSVRLVGYDTHPALELPSAALLVCVSVAWKVGARTGVCTRSAIVAYRPGGPCKIAAPAASGAT
jgi:Tfp pilus assembly protein PilV